MAIDLLRHNGQDDEVAHLYRLDMESFVWVVVWICLQYKERTSRTPRPLDAWVKVDAKGSVLQKRDFLADPPAPRGTTHRARILATVNSLHDRQNARDSKKTLLDTFETQLSDRMADSTLGTSQIAELEQKIKQLKIDVVEQSDDAAFKDFTETIGFGSNDIDAVVSRVRPL
ncbi:hypothetical protein BU15DRAFT_71174 [Melanogaster broomeanus]|nr:hypothetical protein BU15DRAFT_71174 [Melanogaster broomeanus]